MYPIAACLNRTPLVLFDKSSFYDLFLSLARFKKRKIGVVVHSASKWTLGFLAVIEELYQLKMLFFSYTP